MRAMKNKMPGLAQQKIEQLASMNDGNVLSFSGSNEFWSKQRDNLSFNQLQKFWTGLSPKARQELLKIDKQTFFEQARKNTYCSRCNGLLLESFVQIVLYGKSVQQGAGATYNSGALKNRNEGECVGHGSKDEMVDPSVHPWGGLTTTKDGLLSLLDCYLYSKSLKGVQNVFDGARSRERGREMLYPDACGGEGRGWISQRIANYGRGHGARETCALHTARLSCDTLVDFWSALGEETRLSLLRIKEEDFTEKLMYRFESKRFCRDCRKNVIREYKELKELKRLHWETRCTTSFCCPDAAFQYEVTHDTVQADWRQTFADTAVAYHHFEWAVGSGEGTSDIVEFRSVGMSGSVRISGLDLRGLSVCFITLRAWRLDGRCSELSVKANALKGSQRCVHCRLVVGDGYISITRGESIRKFFEHAEEAEEEEDDDSMDNDGNDPDGEYSRPLKHAKSPELAREFLLDAATVIFKEQVEKAFREGTARQNAHSIFVCLALKLLEERVHVACKEIITLEKQMKLLEEEEREKREEEERKERKRTKEREKKQRRKERIKGKEKEKEKGGSESNIISTITDATMGKVSAEDKKSNDFTCRDSATETVRTLTSSSRSPEPPNRHAPLAVQSSSYAEPDEDNGSMKDAVGCFTIEQSQSTHQGHIFQKDAQLEQTSKCSEERQYSASSNSASVASRSELRCHDDNSEASSRTGHGLQRQVNRPNSSIQSCGPKYSLNIRSGNERPRNRYENHDCNCNQISKHRAKAQSHVSRAPKAMSKSESALNITKQFSHGKYRQTEYSNDSSGRPKSRAVIWSNSSRNLRNSNEVWEPLEPKKYPRSNSDSNVTIRSSGFKEGIIDSDRNIVNSPNGVFSNEISAVNCEDKNVNSSLVKDSACRSIPLVHEKDSLYSKESDNISWHGEGDGSTSTSNNGSTESSSTSDSEDASQISGGKESSTCGQVGFSGSHDDEAGTKETTGPVGFSGSHDDEAGTKQTTVREHAFEHKAQSEFSHDGVASRLPGDQFTQAPHQQYTRRATLGIGPIGYQPQNSCRLDNSEITYPLLQAHSAMGYYQQPPVSWPPAPAGGFLPHSHHNQYAYGGPLGYGPNGNSSYLWHYDPLHSIGSPLFSPQLPVCRPSTATNIMTSEEKYQNFQPGVAVPQADGATMEKAVAGIAAALGGTSRRDVCRNNHFSRSQEDNSNFSLFHCGIPATISARDEIIGKFSSKSSANHAVDDRICNKESPGGEYNLFSSSNSFKISLF